MSEEQASQEIKSYEYRVEDTPRYVVIEESWELHDVFPAKWNAGNKVLVFRREVKPPIYPNNQTKSDV